MTDFRRLSLSALIVRLLFLAALPFVFDTCDLVNAPGAVGGDITLHFNGVATMVVNQAVKPSVDVSQVGVGPVADPRLQFSSSDVNIITVDNSTGTVMPVARGTAKIYARLVGSTVGANPPQDSVTVQVMAAAVRADLGTLSLHSINDSATLVAHPLDANNANIIKGNVNVGWTSSAPGIVAVTDSLGGKVKAISNGTGVRLVAEIDGHKDTVVVDVHQVLNGYVFTPSQLTFISLGDTATVIATPKDSGGTTIPVGVAPAVTLTSTFPSTAQISLAGKVTALANGNAGIEARSGSVTDTLPVSVQQIAEQVVITGPDSVLIEAIGDTTKLIALASDGLSGAILNNNPHFKTLDANIAIVDNASGVVRSLSVGGPARIVAFLENGADTVRVYVTNDPRVLDVTPVNVLITAVGDATQLAGTPRNRLGAVLPTIPVTWMTTDPSVAIVNATGLVTATGVGTGRIVGNATTGSLVLADTAVVVVVNSPDSVNITSADSTLTSFNDTWAPGATIKNSRGAPLARSAVTWVSDDPGIASVSPVGLVRAIALGTTTIHATNPDNAARTDSVKVTVANVPTAISLNRTLDTLTAPTKTLAYVADSRNARGVQIDATAITWVSSSPAVATVTGGLATAVGPGTTTISAQVNGASGVLSAGATLVVRNAPKTISVSPTAAQLTFVGETQQVTPTVLNDLGNQVPGITITWSTSNPAVASVSASGLVTALTVGTTIITAQVNNLTDVLSAETTIEVSNAPASIDINQTLVTLASIDDVFPTTGTYLSGQGASLPSTSAAWTSDDPSVADVSSAGVITARARGTTIVRAKSPRDANITDAVTVTVTNAPVSLTLNRTVDNLSSLGRTLSYTATVLNARGATIATEPVTWTSTVGSVASLAAGTAQTNTATALAVGTTSIVATAGTGLGAVSDAATLNVANTAVSVSISPAPANIASVGATLLLTATARNELGNVIPGATVTWNTLNSSVVSFVAPNGTARGEGVGSATVTATVDAVTAQLTVSVANDLTVVDIITGNTTLASVNDTLIPTVDFRNGAGTSLPSDVAVWSTTDLNVASVSSNGTIVARGTGSAVIRAASPLNAGTFDEITITVTNSPATVTLNRTSDVLAAPGLTLSYTATARNARGGVIANQSLTWSVAPGGFATIDQTGLATAVAVGTTTVKATANGGTNPFATATLVVTNDPVSVTVSPTTLVLTSISQTGTVTATPRNVLGNAVSGVPVTWGTSNAGVATASTPGGTTTVTAQGVGTATITATDSAGNVATVSVTVRNDATVVLIAPSAVTLGNLFRTDTPASIFQNALGGSVPRTSVLWTTDNPSVVTVSSSGVVTAVGAGTARVTATSPANGASDFVDYTVDDPANSVALDHATDSLTALGRTAQFLATVRDSAGNVLPAATVAWSIPVNPGALSRTPTAGPSTTVTALAETGGSPATLRATVTSATLAGPVVADATIGVGNDPASVVVTPSAVTITSIAATASVTPTVRNHLGNPIAGATVTWSVVPVAGVVSVPGGSTSGAQNITATGTGTASVTITAGAGITTTFPVTVRDDPTTVDFGATVAVTLANLRRTDDLGGSGQTTIQDALGLTLPATAVLWTTTNASVASVSASGVVTGVGAGTAKIAATSPVDPTRTDTVTYTVQAPAYTIVLDRSTDTLTALTQTRVYTATVRDSLGNVLPGAGGSVAWTDANNSGPQVTFTPTSGLTTTATAAAVSGATRATLTATVTPATILAGATLAASVDIGVGNDPATVAASPSSATITSVGGTVPVTPTVRNNIGGVISGALVTWATSNAGVVSVPLVATSGAQNITATGIGTATVTITAATGVTTTVFVTVARVASAATSQITALPASISANGVATSTITVQLKDANSTNLTTGGDAVTLSFSGPALGATLGTVIDQHDGTYIATLASGTTSGTVTVIGTVNTVPISDNATVTLTAGAAAQLVVVTEPPSSSTAGVSFTTVIEVRDQFGNPVTTDPDGGTTEQVTVAFTGGTNTEGATLSGTTTQAVNWTTGRATFADLSVDLVGDYSLTATGVGFTPSLTDAISATFDVTPGAASQLVFVTQPPASWIAGLMFTSVVEVRDQFGNTVTADPDGGTTEQVTVAFTGGTNTEGATLSGTTTQAVNWSTGRATFADLSVNLVGNYSLTAAGVGFTPPLTDAISSTFDITPAGIDHVTLAGPASLTAGVVSTPFTLTARDQFGNVTITDAPTVFDLSGDGVPSFFSDAGGLNPITQVTIPDKASTADFYFSNTLAGSRTVTATWNSGGSDLGFAQAFLTVTAAAPASLVFSTEPPASSVAGATFTSVAEVRDQFGNTVTADPDGGTTEQVTVAFTGGTNTEGAALSGTTTQAVDWTTGRATFADLSVDLVGNYSLTATGAGFTPPLTDAVSSTFDITPAPLDHFTISTISSPQASNTDITVDVTAQDAFDNTVTAFDGTGNNVVITASNGVSVTVGSPSADFTAGVLTGHIIQLSTSLSTGTEVVVTGGGKTGASNTFTLDP